MGNQSEGIPLRDISSLGAMDWVPGRDGLGSGQAGEFFRRRRRRALWMEGTHSIVIILRRTYSIVIIPIKEDLFDSNHTN